MTCQNFLFAVHIFDIESLFNFKNILIFKLLFMQYLHTSHKVPHNKTLFRQKLAILDH